MTTIRTKVTTLVVGMGLVGGGLLTADALASPAGSSHSLLSAIQSSSDDEANDSACPPDQQTVADNDNVQDENGADDAAEGDNGDQTVQPGQLDDGKELQSQAMVTLDQAVATAQGAAQGDLGEVDLEMRDGTLVYTIDIGANDVHVDAKNGSVVSVTASDESCDSETPVAAGTLDDGKEFQSQAKITIDQAITAAQRAATGDVGEIDLEMRDGTLVYTVDIGDQDVHVDAATGTVVDIGKD